MRALLRANSGKLVKAMLLKHEWDKNDAQFAKVVAADIKSWMLEQLSEAEFILRRNVRKCLPSAPVGVPRKLQRGREPVRHQRCLDESAAYSAARQPDGCAAPSRSWCECGFALGRECASVVTSFQIEMGWFFLSRRSQFYDQIFGGTSRSVNRSPRGDEEGRFYGCLR